ncbi:glycosyltransferase [Prevotella denticola]|uniref:glycosyltransferase n=1 Tax=Prevotella denticola TaxID=28129 RepID=UPI001C606870|nr:glycosyltransferase [Prevotella denticola]MBW4715370.1 glycosyltransferase [Prevotella denticola]MBW4753220.1 glycosyltransferase [Prevotella denticola]
MKKKVLFIIGTLQSGGVSKSMVSLLNVWDRDKYETSLLLCCMEGDVFSKYLPEDVNVIYNPIIEHVMGGFSSAKWLFLHRHILLSIGVLFRFLLSCVSKALSGELIAKMMPIVSNEHYDLIVDYGGQQLLYYMVNKLKGTRKVTFFHNDYSKWPYYYKADKKYYPKVDNIFSISKTCTDALKKYFPNCAEKVSIMENISSPNVIHSQAKDFTNELSEMLQGYKNEGNTILCTVAHFCRRKGGDFTIESAEMLKKQHIKFKWLFVGKVLEEDLCYLIKEKGLEENIIFVGVQSNPYPYMYLSDIYVQPSRYEGKSISLDEAKILCKPIIVTNFSTVGDQFVNGKNATICEMNGEAVANAIIELIKNPDLEEAYRTYLRTHIVDNSSEVNKLYKYL